MTWKKGVYVGVPLHPLFSVWQTGFRNPNRKGQTHLLGSMGHGWLASLVLWRWLVSDDFFRGVGGLDGGSVELIRASDYTVGVKATKLHSTKKGRRGTVYVRNCASLSWDRPSSVYITSEHCLKDVWAHFGNPLATCMCCRSIPPPISIKK